MKSEVTSTRQALDASSDHNSSETEMTMQEVGASQPLTPLPLNELPAGIVMVPVAAMNTGKPFVDLFHITLETEEAIRRDMASHGFDPSQPVVIWKETGLVVDGHTRLKAAQAAGIEDIPVVYKSFDTEYAAIAYAIHAQKDRRNMTDAAILLLVEALDVRKTRGGDRKSPEAKSKPKAEVIGPSSEATANLIGTSPSTVEKARAILDSKDPELKEAVLSGQTSVNQAAGKARALKHAGSDPDPVKVLTSVAKSLRVNVSELAVLKSLPFAKEMAEQIETFANAMDIHVSQLKAETKAKAGAKGKKTVGKKGGTYDAAA